MIAKADSSMLRSAEPVRDWHYFVESARLCIPSMLNRGKGTADDVYDMPWRAETAIS
jgi:hypothetical protein